MSGRPVRDDDGRHDFDFLFGDWHVANHKMSDPLAQHAEWFDFEATSEERPVLGGLGNIERYSAPAFPGRGAFEALALRLFEPETRLWRIWWTSTARPGVVEIPVVGSFTPGHGVFVADDMVGAQALKVRFDWRSQTSTSARWEQAFSFDEGESWITNWIMEFSRAG